MIVIVKWCRYRIAASSDTSPAPRSRWPPDPLPVAPLRAVPAGCSLASAPVSPLRVVLGARPPGTVPVSAFGAVPAGCWSGSAQVAGHSNRTRVPRPGADAIVATPPTAAIRAITDSRRPRRCAATCAGSKPGPSSESSTSTPPSAGNARSHARLPPACLVTFVSASATAAASADPTTAGTARSVIASSTGRAGRIRSVIGLSHCARSRAPGPASPVDGTSLAGSWIRSITRRSRPACARRVAELTSPPAATTVRVADTLSWSSR